MPPVVGGKRQGWMLSTLALGALVWLLAASVAHARPGDVDPTFGGGVMVDQPSGIPTAGLVLQPDGKPVAVVQSSLVRYLANGALDGGFGSNGRATIERQAFDRYPDAALAPNGDIVVSGAVSYTPDYYIYTSVERYLPNGQPDSSFGSDGQATTRTGGYGGNAVAVQPDSKIVVGAAGENGIELLRYLPNGQPDPTFGSNGVVATTLGGRVNALALDADGRILIATASDVMRFSPSGAPDTGFGSGGTAATGADADAFTLQPDGKIVVAGAAGYAMRLTRLTDSGHLDQSFGSGGSVSIPPYTSPNAINPASTAALAVTLEPDGRIVAAGYNWDGSYGAPDVLALARVDQSGALDRSFGDGGRVLTPVPRGLTGILTAVAAQPDGNLVATGYATGDGTGHLVIARFLGGGSSGGDGSSSGAGSSSGGASGTCCTAPAGGQSASPPAHRAARACRARKRRRGHHAPQCRRRTRHHRARRRR